MFESVGSYLLFVIPMTTAVILGIIFEEKLIDFENHLFSAVKSAAKKPLKGIKPHGTTNKSI